MLLLAAALVAGIALGLLLARRGFYRSLGRAVDTALFLMVYGIVFTVGVEAGSSLRESSRNELAEIALSSIAYAAAVTVASLAAAILVLRLTGGGRR